MKPLVLCFSQTYLQQERILRKNPRILDFSGVPGTSCYLDEEARQFIKGALVREGCQGIHFLDSGNYHYVTLLFIEQIQEPFRLLVFDNHTDMQPPAFGGILSCGSWLGEALETLPFLYEVILLGPDEEAYAHTDPALRRKVRFFSREMLQEDLGRVEAALEECGHGLPLYLSIDKDILRPSEAVTDWNQGELSLEELLRLIRAVPTSFCGADICGDSKDAVGEDSWINEEANLALLEVLEWNQASEGEPEP